MIPFPSKRILRNCTKSHLKNWILAQDQGWTEFQSAGIFKYIEELKRGLNTEMGTKDFFAMAFNVKFG
jgi:hypothetical protein